MALQVLEHGLAGFQYLWAITLAQLLSFLVLNLYPSLVTKAKFLGRVTGIPNPTSSSGLMTLSHPTKCIFFFFAVIP